MEGGTNGRTDERTNEQTNESPPVFYRTLSPLGPLPKNETMKGETKEKKKERKKERKTHGPSYRRMKPLI